MVELAPMSAERFERWRSTIWQVYYDELIQAGYSDEYARENCGEHAQANMPGGTHDDGHWALAIVHEGREIGHTWLVQLSDTEWSIYDVEVDEAERGRGFGRSGMRAIEAWVAERGGTSIGLYVFGFNETARALYASEGYDTLRIQMRKRLTP
ncbi:MAG TPA: GNAT family N-acetyltransferase [Microbacteriaceae bacterium]|nr:GNAT family N-acetyltransferase [Microbacteriaceae bacterium]